MLVATPGRLIDLYNQNAVKFDQLKILVLDEADKMLGLGFSDEVNRLVNLLPKRRQTLMFSATFSTEIRHLAGKMLHEPIEITVSSERVAAIEVDQWLAPVDKQRKTALLLFLLTNNH